MATDQGGGPSFDPRTWRATDAGEPRPAEPQPPAPPRSRNRRLVLAGLAVSGLAGVGSAALVFRPHRPAGAAPKAAPASGLRRRLTVSGPHDLVDALRTVGLEPTRAQAWAQAAADVLGPGPGELRLLVQLAPEGARPVRLEARRTDGSGVLVVADASGAPRASRLSSDLSTRVKVVRGEMDANSFYSSAVAAGVTDSLISDFAKAFAFDFDFQREIRPGDIFEAAFEQTLNGAGDSIGPEQLLYASLQTQAKSRALYRFRAGADAEASWFDANGSSVVRSLMRTPVEGARISSSFGPRMHPVLGYTRMHKGTDFATPIGTPVYASGDGVVDFVGVHGGHGNYMRIRHSPTLETAYAHLSAYGSGMAVGTAVRQGQPIALSGNSGLSSGPHLHYEVIVNEEQVDPMTFETTQGRVLKGGDLVAFRKERDRIDALRAAQNG